MPGSSGSRSRRCWRFRRRLVVLPFASMVVVIDHRCSRSGELAAPADCVGASGEKWLPSLCLRLATSAFRYLRSCENSGFVGAGIVWISSPIRLSCFSIRPNSYSKSKGSFKRSSSPIPKPMLLRCVGHPLGSFNLAGHDKRHHSCSCRPTTPRNFPLHRTRNSRCYMKKGNH